MKKLFLILLCLCLLATAPAAQKKKRLEWLLITINTSYKFYYNRLTLTRPKTQIVRAQIKLVPFNEQARQGEIAAIEDEGAPGEFADYGYTVSLDEYDCERMRYHSLSHTLFNLSGKVIHKSNEETKWRQIPLGSVVEEIATTVCNVEV